MNQSLLHHLLTPFHDMFADYISVVSSYKNNTGRKVLALSCDFLPFEILAAYNTTPLKIPFTIAHQIHQMNTLSAPDMEHVTLPFDLIISHNSCPDFPALFLTQNIQEYCCNTFNGYGEDASIEIHEIIGTLLRENNLGDIEALQNETLQNTAAPIDTVRKLVRGISSLRREKPDLLSNSDIFTIFDAAMCFPAELVIDTLQGLLDAMNSESSHYRNDHIPVLVNAWSIRDFSLLDDIEDAGFIIVEDDICGGRRQFDLSFNVASGYLYYEILNSFSFKPLCPSIRPAGERFDLLYKLLRNHGISTVLFLTDKDNPVHSGQTEYLRKKLMRSGIDPVIADTDNIIDAVTTYKRYSMR
jgi:hypothetical protein